MYEETGEWSWKIDTGTWNVKYRQAWRGRIAELSLDELQFDSWTKMILVQNPYMIFS